MTIRFFCNSALDENAPVETILSGKNKTKNFTRNTNVTPGLSNTFFPILEKLVREN